MAKQGYEHMSISDMETSGHQEDGYAARGGQAAGGSWSTPPTDEFEERYNHQGAYSNTAATVVPGYPVMMPSAPPMSSAMAVGAAPVGLVVQDPPRMSRREWKQARRERKRARRQSRRNAGPVQTLFGLVRNAILLAAQDPHQQAQNQQQHCLQDHQSYQNPQDHQSYQNHLPRPGYQ